MTLREAQILTLRVLKQVMEEKLDHHNVQLAQVRGVFRYLVSVTDHGYMRILQVSPQIGFEILDERKLKEIIEAM